MLAIKILEISLSGNPALIALRPAGKNICSSVHLLTGDFIYYYYFNLQAFVPTTLEKQFQNRPQPWAAQQRPHLYAAALSPEGHSATPFLTAPHRAAQRCRWDLTSSPAHFLFPAGCLTVCSESPRQAISRGHCSGCRARPCQHSPSSSTLALSSPHLFHTRCFAQRGARSLFLYKELIWIFIYNPLVLKGDKEKSAFSAHCRSVRLRNLLEVSKIRV